MKAILRWLVLQWWLLCHRVRRFIKGRDWSGQAAAAARATVKALQAAVRITVTVVRAIWDLLVTIAKSPQVQALLTAMRQNPFATIVVFAGLTMIFVILSLEEPQVEPPVVVDPLPADRPDFTIGAIISLTGKYERRGNEMRRGYELALRAVNGSGGVRLDGVPHNLSLVIYDDESHPVRAAEVAQLLFTHDAPLVLLAPYSSLLARPVLLAARERGVPAVVPVASAAGLEEKAGAFVLQSPPHRHLLGAAELFAQRVALVSTAHAAAKRAGTAGDNVPFVTGETPRVGFITARDPHSRAVMDAVRQALHAAGIDEQVDLDLAGLAAAGPAELDKVDALFVAAYADGANALLDQVTAAGHHVPFLAMTHCDVAQITRRTPLAAEGTLCALHWQPESMFAGTGPLNENFATDFHREYGSNPSHQAAAAAAAVVVITDALRRVGSKSADIAAALAATRLPTFYGPVEFDGNGHNKAKPMVLSQVVRARYLPVAPPEIAQAQPNYLRPELPVPK